MSETAYDVIALGSGFGGSLLATILSRQGLRVAILDTARHLRFAIGESSTPAADLILHDLATHYDLPELLPLCRFGTWREAYPDIRCGCKRGFSYFSHGSGDELTSSVDHARELLVAASASREVADTHWYRPQVDQYFMQVANRRGCDSWEGIEELRIRHEGPSDWKIGFRHEGKSLRLAAEFLIDATGGRGIVLDALGIGSSADSLRTRSRAIYGHWENLARLGDLLHDRGVNIGEYPFPCDDAAVHHLFHDGWMWSLRFEDGLTSAGFVYGGADAEASRVDDPQSEWQRLIGRSPILGSVFQSAKLAEWPGKIYRTERLQRIADRGAGADWAALPATIGFIDPLHSTGIAHTMSAIEVLSGILSVGHDRSARLHDYSNRILRELGWIDLLVAGCYRGLRHFELFVSWSMIYFAAATTFEARRSASSRNGDSSEAFLCADDLTFRRIVEGFWTHLDELTDGRTALSPAQIERFRESVKTRIAPFNRVGLFSPERPHLYEHTVAEKS